MSGCTQEPQGEAPRGLWVHASAWEQAPVEAAHPDGSLPQHAYALVANFCADGKLRIWSGSLYSSTTLDEATLGVSDGITLYSGTWRHEGERVGVEYRLKSAEISVRRADGQPIDEHRTVSTTAQVNDDRLEFQFESRLGTRNNLSMVRARAFDRKLDDQDQFIRCAPPPAQ